MSKLPIETLWMPEQDEKFSSVGFSPILDYFEVYVTRKNGELHLSTRGTDRELVLAEFHRLSTKVPNSKMVSYYDA